jgi:hypothetical protein
MEYSPDPNTHSETHSIYKILVHILKLTQYIPDPSKRSENLQYSSAPVHVLKLIQYISDPSTRSENNNEWRCASTHPYAFMKRTGTAFFISYVVRPSFYVTFFDDGFAVSTFSVSKVSLTI